jgi:hypothetical protein
MTDIKQPSTTASTAIDRVHVRNLTADDFVNRYLATNRPVIISGLTDHWLARHKWIKPTTVATSNEPSTPVPVGAATSPSVSVPNFDHLVATFGASVCQVAECAQRSYSEQKRTDMTLSSFVQCWTRGDYATPSTCRYLKDWHMTADCPQGYVAYTTPPHFADDWMNAYWDAEGRDDFRFVYMGPNHTWTPLHRDVYKSYSWSTNICGKKRWLMYPPTVSHQLFDATNHLVYDVTQPIDNQRYPIGCDTR